MHPVFPATWVVLLTVGLGVGCAGRQDGDGGASKEPGREDLQQLAEREVVALHDFIAAWSLGTLEDTDEEYARFAEALAPDFVLIGPDGGRTARAGIVQGFRSAHGRWQDFEPARLEVRAVRTVASSESWVAVEYQEWHFVGEETTARRSTVVFRRAESAPGGVLWQHLHETWMPTAGTEGEGDG